jgi:C4-dicarboxylate transporter DctQ subunit
MSSAEMGTRPAADLEAEEAPEKYSPEEWCIAIALVVMTVTLFAQIVARFIFGTSFTWSEELTRYLFLWLVFAGLGVVTLRSEHIVVDAAISWLPEKSRRILQQICYVVLLVVNIIFAAAAVQMVYIIFDLGQESPALALPMWLVYLSLPVGLVLASLRLIQVSVRLWRDRTHTDRMAGDQ